MVLLPCRFLLLGQVSVRVNDVPATESVSMTHYTIVSLFIIHHSLTISNTFPSTPTVSVVKSSDYFKQLPNPSNTSDNMQNEITFCLNVQLFFFSLIISYEPQNNLPELSIVYKRHRGKKKRKKCYTKFSLHYKDMQDI